MGEGVFLDALTAAAFFLVVSYLAYVSLIVIPFLRRRPGQVGDGSQYDWHFLVPCLNEEAVIGDTVRRLVDQFPSAHVWCIDDASDDTTPAVLAALAAQSERVHVVTRRPPDARQGKGPALNAAWRHVVESLPPDVDAERVILGVVDADGHLDRRCLDVVAGPELLGDPSVCGIQIKVRVVNRAARAADGGSTLSRFGRLLIRLQDSEFTGVIAAQQTLRRHLGSVGMGGNGQFTRLSALNAIAAEHGTPWHGSLLEDFELGLHILLTGRRTQYCHDTWVEQEGLHSVRRLVRQRSRWAQGSMQCFRYMLPVLRSPVISTTGAVEIAYFLILPWVQLIGTTLYVLTTGLFLWYATHTPGGPLAWLDAGAWGLIPLFVLFGLGPLLVWGPIYRSTVDRSLSRRRALAFGFANWPYTLVHYVATWKAFGRVVRSRHDWVKTERIAPRPAIAPVVPMPAVRVAAASSPPATVPNVVVGTFALARSGDPSSHTFARTTAVGSFRVRTTENASDHRRVDNAA